MVLGRITRGRHTDNPSGCYSTRTNQQSTSINPPIFTPDALLATNLLIYPGFGKVQKYAGLQAPVACLHRQTESYSKITLTTMTCNKKHKNHMCGNCYTGRKLMSNSRQITYKRLTYKCYWNVVNWAELTVKPVECVERIGNILSADAAIAESSYQLQLFHCVQGGRCHRAVYRCRHCLCTANSSVFLPQQTRHSVIQIQCTQQQRQCQ